MMTRSRSFLTNLKSTSDLAYDSRVAPTCWYARRSRTPRMTPPRTLDIRAQVASYE